MKIYFILVFIILFTNCKNNNGPGTKALSTDGTCATNFTREKTDSMILASAKMFNYKFGNNDPCYIDYLDSLVNRCCKENNDLNFILLDSLGRIRDGYVAGYFEVIGIQLFDSCFIKLLNYAEKYYPNDLSKSPSVDAVREGLDIALIPFANLDVTEESTLNKLSYYYFKTTNPKSQNLIRSWQKRYKNYEEKLSKNLKDLEGTR